MTRQFLPLAIVTVRQTKHTGGVTFRWCRCKWVLSSLKKHESQAWSDVSWMVDQSQASGKRNYLAYLMCADPLGGSCTSHRHGRFCRVATRIRLFRLQCASGFWQHSDIEAGKGAISPDHRTLRQHSSSKRLRAVALNCDGLLSVQHSRCMGVDRIHISGPIINASVPGFFA